MKWISVKDRLPEECDWNLVLDKERGVWGVAKFNNDNWEFYDEDSINKFGMVDGRKIGSCGFINEKCDALYSRQITHWMPLPELPSK